MNTEFIRSKHQSFTYTLKEGTKTSFKHSEGFKNILPETISFTNYYGKEGRRKAKFQLSGKYKLLEHGFYYAMNDRKVHTKIMEINDYPMFIGWGEIDARHKIYDLIIVFSMDNCKSSFEIHLFKGLANIEYLNDACSYLQSHINNKLKSS